MGDENTDKLWVVIELVEQLSKTREIILELSKDMHCPVNRCPLTNENIDHYAISKFLVYGGWTWNCPFCGENFQN